MVDVGGLIPLSTSDYPGCLSAVVFLQGCPWRCGYCHNPGLQGRGQPEALPWSHVVDFLDRRRGLLDAVVFSGGEPTLHARLPRAIDEVRHRGFRVALHTAGVYPGRLAAVLSRLSWVGLDIKARFDDYARVIGRRVGANSARESLRLLLESNVDFEVRTTYHPRYFPGDALLELAGTLSRAGVRRFALQEFNASGCNDEALARSARSVDDELVARMEPMFETFELRRGSTPVWP